MDSGRLVDDSLVLGMIRERLQEPDTRRGFILDGFPRNLAQAHALDHLLEALRQPLDAVVQLEVDYGELVRRISGRRTCADCGRVFNLPTSPPSGTSARCPKSGQPHRLVQRPDDNEATVAERLRVYDEKTRPLIDFYRARGLLRVLDAEGDLDTVTRRLAQTLGLPALRSAPKPKRAARRARAGRSGAPSRARQAHDSALSRPQEGRAQASRRASRAGRPPRNAPARAARDAASHASAFTAPRAAARRAPHGASRAAARRRAPRRPAPRGHAAWPAPRARAAVRSRPTGTDAAEFLQQCRLQRVRAAPGAAMAARGSGIAAASMQPEQLRAAALHQPGRHLRNAPPGLRCCAALAARSRAARPHRGSSRADGRAPCALRSRQAASERARRSRPSSRWRSPLSRIQASSGSTDRLVSSVSARELLARATRGAPAAPVPPAAARRAAAGSCTSSRAYVICSAESGRRDQSVRVWDLARSCPSRRRTASA